MDVLTSETCWALDNEIIKQVTSSWSLFIQRWKCPFPYHEGTERFNFSSNHSFLNSVLDGGELSASRASCFTFLGANVQCSSNRRLGVSQRMTHEFVTGQSQFPRIELFVYAVTVPRDAPYLVRRIQIRLCYEIRYLKMLCSWYTLISFCSFLSFLSRIVVCTVCKP